MPTNTVRLHRVLRAAPERASRAFLDPDAGQVAAAPYADQFDDQNLPGEMRVTVSLKNVVP